MKRISTLTAVTATVLAASLFIAPASFAKAHDQSTQSEAKGTAPGENVGPETVGPAQGLGSALGQGRGPADTPAGANPGNSENAGRSGDMGGKGGDMSGKN